LVSEPAVSDAVLIVPAVSFWAVVVSPVPVCAQPARAKKKRTAEKSLVKRDPPRFGRESYNTGG
jgi:hypothetical protein